MATLSKIDWIRAGFETLTKNGVEGLKIELIATTLKVSKGSFYWHFKNRDFFFEEMIEYWENQATDNIIDIVDRAHHDPLERLVHLCNICFRPVRFDRVESTLRIWATTNKRVAKACKRVDLKRIQYVKNLLISIGVEKSIAASRANLMYLALIGSSTWVHSGGRKMTSKELDDLVYLLTIT